MFSVAADFSQTVNGHVMMNAGWCVHDGIEAKLPSNQFAKNKQHKNVGPLNVFGRLSSLSRSKPAADSCNGVAVLAKILAVLANSVAALAGHMAPFSLSDERRPNRPLGRANLPTPTADFQSQTICMVCKVRRDSWSWEIQAREG